MVPKTPIPNHHPSSKHPQAETALADLSLSTSPTFKFTDAELLNINLRPLNTNLQNPILVAIGRQAKWIHM
jgi:hypothetical protein